MGEVSSVMFPVKQLITYYLLLILIPTFVCSSLIIVDNEVHDTAVKKGENSPVRY